MLNYKMLISLAMLSLSTAYGQDSVDAHGFNLVPSDGDVLDGLAVWRAERNNKHAFGVTGLLEYAADPIVVFEQYGDETYRNSIIEDMTLLNLGLFYSPSKRLSFGLSSPLYLSVDGDNPSGVGIGDFRVSASGLLIRPPEDRLGLGLSLIPFADIPGFYNNDQLKLAGLSGGGLLASSLTGRNWDVSGNLGVQLTPEVNYLNVTGREKLLVGASVGWEFVPNIAARLETTLRPTLRDNLEAWTDSPVELLGSVRGYSGHTLSWTFGGATALSRGLSAATWRLFAGLGLSVGARDAEECLGCDYSRFAIMLVDETGEMIPLDEAGVGLDIYSFVTNSFTGMGANDGSFAYLTPGNDYILRIMTRKEDCTVVGTNSELLLLEPIYFDFDQDTIRMPDSHNTLLNLAETLKEHEEVVQIEIQTGTDVRGTNEYNEDLAERRAQSVVDFLLEQGVSEERLTTVSFGERQLTNEECDTEECHEENRYAKFTILAVER